MVGQIDTVILLPVDCDVILTWQQSLVNCIKYGQRIFLSSALMYFFFFFVSYLGILLS